MDKNDVYGRVIYINLEAVVRADDTGGARGAMAPPPFLQNNTFCFFCKIVFHHRVHGFYISITGFFAF